MVWAAQIFVSHAPSRTEREFEGEFGGINRLRRMSPAFMILHAKK